MNSEAKLRILVAQPMNIKVGVKWWNLQARRRFRGAPPPPPVQSHNDKGGGGGLFPVDLSSFSTDCLYLILSKAPPVPNFLDLPLEAEWICQS